MMKFDPTDQQRAVIAHQGSAFITACPGAGKTRVMVERGRALLTYGNDRRGIAFLSFTNAAVDELEDRLRINGLLPSPPFPNFIGTFDAFLWQYVVAPFELLAGGVWAKLIPDKQNILVRPFPAAQALPLKCFDRQTGLMLSAQSRPFGFNPDANVGRTRQYVTAASTIRKRMMECGEIDFHEARVIAVERLAAANPDSPLAKAISARFREVIVDEAQDCNPDDLKIIDWLRAAGIPTKVICDPHQSIYEFRGGVTEHLFRYAETFDERDRLSMSGNFRSNPAICRAISAMRSRDHREPVDAPLGKLKDDKTKVKILDYSGAVSVAIGQAFAASLLVAGIPVSDSPILAATKLSGAKAVGQPIEATRKNLTSRLALAVTAVHFANDPRALRDALAELHEVVLEVGDKLERLTYHQYIIENGLADGGWRSSILSIANQLRYEPGVFPTPADWHAKAKLLLAPHLAPGGPTIAQKLPANVGLGDVLSAPGGDTPLAKTIHSVKGREFPAVCVVLTTATAKGILDYLRTGAPAGRAEDAREIYVAASRAERLLVLAVPRAQAGNFANHLRACGAEVEVIQI